MTFARRFYDETIEYSATEHHDGYTERNAVIQQSIGQHITSITTVSITAPYPHLIMTQMSGSVQQISLTGDEVLRLRDILNEMFPTQ